MKTQQIYEELENKNDIEKLIFIDGLLNELKEQRKLLKPMYDTLSEKLYNEGKTELGNGIYIKKTSNTSKSVNSEQLFSAERGLYDDLATDGALELPRKKIVEYESALGYLVDEKIKNKYKVEGVKSYDQ